MQLVGSVKAHDALIENGLPRLRALIRERLSHPERTRLPALFALKIVAIYRQREDVALFIEAARAPLEPDSYWWVPAFYAFTAENAHTPALVAGLASPLPVGFIRIAYLDCCNSLAVSEQLPDHPFASAEGAAQLEEWLKSTKAEETSYAVSTCVAIPFLPSPTRERLLDLATRHADVKVRIEAAWACAKSGLPGGAEKLIEFARDPRYSATAVHYLNEIGHCRSGAPEVRSPDFSALAQMCQWIAHPNEFGRPPEAISQVDTRELYWPPTRDKRQLWMFQYRYEQDDGTVDEGYGLTGSVTWAMFGSNSLDLSAEDVYGLHCAWELIQNEDREAPPESSVAAGKAILAKHNPEFGRPSLRVSPAAS